MAKTLDKTQLPNPNTSTLCLRVYRQRLQYAFWESGQCCLSVRDHLASQQTHNGHVLTLLSSATMSIYSTLQASV